MSGIDQPPPRILIVDDDELMRRLLAKSFTDDGFEVVVAADGRAATDIFSKFAPDVVLMDIMPDREGVETTIALRKLDDTVPIIAMSGGGRIGPSEFLTLAVALGATTSIKKPFTVKQILSLVRQVMPQQTASAT